MPLDCCGCYRANLWSFGQISGRSRALDPLGSVDMARSRMNRKRAATAWQRLQPLSATLTVVKEHAGVRGHRLGCLMAAMRASQSGLKLWFRHAANVAWELSTFQVLDGLTRSTPARKGADRRRRR